MSEFRLHHLVSKLLNFLHVDESPEVYVDLFNQHISAFQTTKAASLAAKKKLADSASDPEAFNAKYDELRLHSKLFYGMDWSKPYLSAIV